MAKLPVATTVGFMVSVADYLDEHKQTLIAKKVDPTDNIAKLRADAATISTENQKQESMKADLKTQTVVVEDKCGAGYADTSGILNTAINTLGMSTPEGQQGARLRSQLHSSKGGGENPPPAPPNP